MIQVDTTGVELSNLEEVQYRRLFEYILYVAKETRIRGAVIIPFDGKGRYGQVKVESYADVLNRNGNSSGDNGDLSSTGKFNRRPEEPKNSQS